MKQRAIAILVVVSSAILTGGCTHAIKDYKASALNVKNIEEKYNKPDVKVKISNFTSDGSETYSLMCRLEGPIKPPSNKSFEAYITDAFKSELNFAGIYSDDSKISFNISFEDISFNSTIGMGKWVIISKLSSENNNDIKVESIYEFSTNYVATVACAQVSDAFPKAVQKFIDDVISHSEFERIINKS